ncbi:uncharacterized protein LOC118757253, partial [Rhagoletis pomonella]|uniref:uncharacterized protein LOC118757253 n=1 Tax=Rhagoletis pomonella TaxID=28610 RepID=UPI0017816B9F
MPSVVSSLQRSSQASSSTAVRSVTQSSSSRQSSNIPRRVLLNNEPEPVQQHQQPLCCIKCKQCHQLKVCPEFKELNVQNKWTLVKANRLCFACLQRGHGFCDCRSRHECGVDKCKRMHHPLLHQAVTSVKPSSSVNRSTVQPATSSATNSNEHLLNCRENQNECLFKILPVVLTGPNGSFAIYAMIDEGSSITLLEESIANSLGVKGRTTPLTLQWYNKKKITEKSRVLNLQVSAESRNTSYQLKNVYTIKQLDLPTQTFERNNYSNLINLPIANYSSVKPALLIGLDNSHLCVAKEMVSCGPNEPIAIATKLGWVVYGPTKVGSGPIANVFHVRKQFSSQQLHRYEMAKKRLLNVENKMAKDPGYAKSYIAEINKYISKGYAQLLTDEESSNPQKLRIVFDAAASVSNVSLNSVLMKGPERAQPLMSLMFRQRPLAVAGDIQEMFSQVKIRPEDRQSQRFLWRHGDPSKRIEVYVMTSMIFGAVCSPCCAEYIKNLNSSRFEEKMPRGVKAVVENTYVDDLVASFDSIQEANEVELQNLLNQGTEAPPDIVSMEHEPKTDKVL